MADGTVGFKPQLSRWSTLGGRALLGQVGRDTRDNFW
jgi:hypothetical protein